MKIQRRQRYPILIYMLGFFLGIIYLNVASTRYVVDVGIWSEWFRSQYLGYDLKSFDYMWYVAQIRLLPAGGLAILGGTKFRKIAAYLFLLWAGLASGMILTSALLMLYKYASAFFVLYTGLCNAFTIFIPISGERMEFYEDVKFCIISYYGNCIRVSGQSGIVENVFENIIKTSILLCVVMRTQKHLA